MQSFMPQSQRNNPAVIFCIVLESTLLQLLSKKSPYVMG